jgi:hypothetical protein
VPEPQASLLLLLSHVVDATHLYSLCFTGLGIRMILMYTVCSSLADLDVAEPSTCDAGLQGINWSVTGRPAVHKHAPLREANCPEEELQAMLGRWVPLS